MRASTTPPALTPVCLAVGLLLAAPAGFATPQGAVLVSGQATVRQTAPGQMDIQQTTPRAQLDWTSFSIAAGERVNVLQPDRTSVLLNRVLGDNPSLIYGALNSNGSVWLINPRGIVFGASSSVNVGSLVASTLAITSEDLASGRLQLGAGAGGAGELRSEGQITATDGSVILVAPQLLHSGQITARRVGLAAASDVLVDVEGDGLVFFNVRNDRLDARLQMLGGVRADGGTAEIRAAARAGFADTVLNMDGVVQARSLGQREGRVVIDGGTAGVTLVGGQIDARGTEAGSHGGDITVLGQRVGLTAQAVLDASGDAGGGRIRVGGDYQGANPDLHNAARVSVVGGASLRADALGQGDGGRIITWSDEVTRFGGTLSARGGAAGGNGGFAEVSGKASLQLTGTVDLAAPQGLGGTLLLDPASIKITATGGPPGLPGGTGDPPTTTVDFGDAGDALEYSKSSLTGLLNGGTNVVLAATDTVTIDATGGAGAAIGSAGATGKLTLRSGGDVIINANVTTGGGIEIHTADATSGAPTGTGHLVLTSNLNAGNGVLLIDGGASTGPHRIGGSLTAGALTITGKVDLTAASTWRVSGSSTASGALTGAFTLTKDGAGALRLGDTSAFTGDLAVADSGGTLVLTRATGSARATIGTGGVLSVDTSAGGLTIDTAALQISGAGTFRKEGSGRLQITGTGQIGSGTVDITGGTLELLAGNIDRIANASAVTVSGGTLTASNASETFASLSLTGGTVDGASALTVGSVSSSGASTLAAAVNASTTSISSGQLTLGAGSLGGAYDIAGPAELVVNRSGSLALGNLTGSGRLRVSTGSVTLNGTASSLSQINVDGGSLTLADGASRLGGGTAVSVAGTLALGDTAQAVNTLSLSGTLSGTGALGATQYTLLSGAAVNAPLSGGAIVTSGGGNRSISKAALVDSVQVGNTATITLASGSSLGANTDVTVNSGGTLSLGADVTARSLDLSGALDGAFTFTSGAGGMTLRAGASVDTASILAGSGTLQVSGSGSVALNGSSTFGQVQVNTGSTLVLGSTADRLLDSSTVTVSAGTLRATNANETFGGLVLAGGTVEGASALSVGTLSSSGTSTLTAAVSATTSASVTGGQLTLGSGGSLSGAIDIAGPAELVVNRSGSLALGNLTGSGQLRVSTGSVTLNGTASSLSQINVDGGSLTLADGASRLGSGTAVSVAGTLALGDTAQTIDTLSLSGTLSGTGGLSATQYTLRSGAAVNAPLSGGAIVTSGGGNRSISKAALVDSVQVGNTATITLASGSSLGANTDVTVNSGGTLSLGADVTARSLDLSGALDGAFTFTSGAGGMALRAGASVDTASILAGSGTLQVSGIGSVALNGRCTFGQVQVNAGSTLVLGSTADRLLDSSTVTVSAGTLRATNANETFGGLVLAGGTVEGASALSVGTLSSSGTSTLTAVVSATTSASVTGGQLTLGSGGSLSGAIDIAGPAELVVNRSGSLALGNLTGSGQLRVSTGSVTLNGTASSLSQINVDGGSLTLADGASRLGSGTAVSVAGTLALGDTAQTIDTLSLSGTLSGTGGLSATQYTLRSGAAVNAPLSGGAIVTSGSGNRSISKLVDVASVQVGNTATITLASGSSLGANTNVTVNSGGRLTLGTSSAARSLDLGGSLDGAFTFTSGAGGTTLRAGASVDTASILAGTGTLQVSGSGSVAFNGRSTFDQLQIAAGSTLNLGPAADRLLDGGDVTALGVLRLGGNETVRNLAWSGTLSGSGTLTASSITLSGNARIDGTASTASAQFTAATLTGTGTLNATTLSSTGTSVLDAQATVGSLNVSDGSFTVATNGLLGGTPVVTLGSGTSLVLQSAQAVSGLIGTGVVTLGGGTLIIDNAGAVNYDGVVSGNGGLTKRGNGNLTLTAAQAYDGATTVSAGTLTLGAAGVLPNGSNLTVAGPATLAMAFSDTVNSLSLSGTLTGAGTLTAATYALETGAQVNAPLGAGRLDVNGTATLNARVDALTVQVKGTGTLTLQSGADLASGASLSILDGGQMTLGADETVASFSSAGRLAGSAFTLSTGLGGSTLQTHAVIDASLAGGDIHVTGDTTLNGRANVGRLFIDNGTLSLGATADRIADGAAVTVAPLAGLALAGDETVSTLQLGGTLSGSFKLTTNAGTTLGTGAVATANLGGSNLLVTGNSTLTGTADATTVQIDGGTLLLNAPNRLADGATVTVGAAGKLQLSGNDTVQTLNLSGELLGSGALTASTEAALDGGKVSLALNTPLLRSRGASTLAATATAANVQVTADELTVTSLGRLAGAPAVALTGALRLQSAQTLSALSGTGTVTLDGAAVGLTVDNAAAVGFDGHLAGSGSFTKRGLGTLTLTGSHTHAGATTVLQGNLALANPEILPDAGSLNVDGTLDGTARLTLGGAERVNELTLTAATLAGTGTLTGLNYTLAGGTVAAGAALGTGTLSSSGNSTLAGTAGATVVALNGGQLTLAGSERLTGRADVTVNAGTLLLQGTQTVRTLDLHGTLAGINQTLSAEDHITLRTGATVTADLAGPRVEVRGDTLLSGHSRASLLEVDSGTLTLDSAGRLAPTSALIVTAGSALTLAGDESVDTATLGGAVAGSGTLSASRYTLQDSAAVDVTLGAGQLDIGTAGVAGVVTLRKAVGATQVHVKGGTLSLQAADLLDNGSAVTVDGGAAMTLNGSDRIGSLQLSGTLGGLGTLSATSYSLRSGIANLALGGGTLSSSGSSQLNRSSGADSVTVLDGQLTLGSAGSFLNAPQVNVALDARLALAGNETIGTLSGAGRVALGAATLTTGQGGDSRFDGVLSGSGGLVKTGNSSFSLTGTHDFSGTTRVAAGTLVLSGSLGSTLVQVDGGLLDVAAGGRLAVGARLDVASGSAFNLAGTVSIDTLNLAGTLGGAGTLNATRYVLSDGTVNANLGGGTLTASGSGISQVNKQLGVDLLTLDSGTLVLGGSQQFSAPTAVTVAGAASLQLGGDQTIGSLAGSGAVALGSHVLTTGARGNSSYDGVLSGAGGLVKQGSSSFTLNGSNTYLGTTRVAAGTLVLGSAERLADTGVLVVDRDATLDLGSNETVRSLTLSGRLTGTGRTLTAGTYLLDGGTVDALLGTGALSSRGTSTINSGVAASSVTVESGTLNLAFGSRLNALPALTVNNGATLQLAGGQAVDTLSGGGTVDLTNQSLSIGGGRGGDSRFSGAITGAGLLIKVGNGSFTLDGTATGSVRVEAGTLALGAADRLADNATVNVFSGATLSLAGNDLIGELDLAGTLRGSGTLSASSYQLFSGRVDANLGAGQLTSKGDSVLNASVGANVVVSEGTLTVNGSNRLADNVTLSVSRGAALQLDGTDTIATLSVGGTLAGTGTLTAANYGVEDGTISANLGSGILSARGNSTLTGLAAVDQVAVQRDSSLTLATAGRLTAAPVVLLNGGSRLTMGGDQRFGSLGGTGELALSSFTVSTGSRFDSIFEGVISGSGGLIKQGSSTTFTLTGANSYTGLTRVSEGTLRVGDDATAGSLSSGRFEVDGTLAFARSDAVLLSKAVSGSGTVEQAGRGRLVFSGSNKTFSGSTRVSQGELATAASGDLSSASTVNVATGGRLLLAGSETVRGIDADGGVALLAGGSTLSATDSLLMRGAVTSAGDLSLSAAQRVLATSVDNRFGGTLALSAGARIDLNAGIENGQARALTIGRLNAAAGGRIDAGGMALAADVDVGGGTLEMVSAAAQTPFVADGQGSSRQITGLPINFAADGVAQGDSGRISVAAGAGLAIRTTGNASVQLLRSGNSFLGDLSVVTGTPGVAWSSGAPAGQNVAVQSRVRIEGGTVNIGGDGIVADVVNIRADRLATVGETATIVARMPFDPSVGTAVSMPALTLELTPEAFNQSFPFGSSAQGLRVDVGSQAYGNRTLPLNAGYITVLPRNGAKGSTAVLLTGPAVGAYRFFFEGAGVQTEIPVFYNGVLPTTPQVQNSISATLAVSEGARKDRFEEAVRTENVAVRLRGGVIAEVGPAPSATQGTDGIRVPLVCPPAAGLLQCGAP